MFFKRRNNKLQRGVVGDLCRASTSSISVFSPLFPFLYFNTNLRLMCNAKKRDANGTLEATSSEVVYDDDSGTKSHDLVQRSFFLKKKQQTKTDVAEGEAVVTRILARARPHSRSLLDQVRSSPVSLSFPTHFAKTHMTMAIHRRSSNNINSHCNDANNSPPIVSNSSNKSISSRFRSFLYIFVNSTRNNI